MTNSREELKKNLREIHNKAQSHRDYIGECGDGVLINEVNMLAVECLNALATVEQSVPPENMDGMHYEHIHIDDNEHSELGVVPVLVPDGFTVVKAVEQEPVAWRRPLGDGEWCYQNEAFKHSFEEIQPLFTHPQPDSKLVEENARLRDALDACLLMCDFSSIPAIETKTKEALKAKGE